MGFQKGNKVGGRRKGSVNKTTAELRQAVNQIVCESIEDMVNDLSELCPETRIRLIIQLLDFVLPKQKVQQDASHVEMPLFPDLTN